MQDADTRSANLSEIEFINNPRPPWQFENPSCAEIGEGLFFIEDQEEKIIQNASVYQEGKRICSVCEHKSECASWAIKNETHGLWGGLSPYERRMFRKRRKIRFLDNI
jgi:hypothetical protein